MWLSLGPNHVFMSGICVGSEGSCEHQNRTILFWERRKWHTLGLLQSVHADQINFFHSHGEYWDTLDSSYTKTPPLKKKEKHSSLMNVYHHKIIIFVTNLLKRNEAKSILEWILVKFYCLKILPSLYWLYYLLCPEKQEVFLLLTFFFLLLTFWGRTKFPIYFIIYDNCWCYHKESKK